MPIYEYLCEGCGRISELMQKLSDPPPRSCPECGSKKLARLVSRTAFQLKGGGWYADLYSSARGKDAKQAAPEATANDKTSTTAPAGDKAAAPAGDKPAAGSEKPAREKKKPSPGPSDA